MLVIGPFITLPARHSAVWVKAISTDSRNYPRIERGREISSRNSTMGQKEFREIRRERAREEGRATSVLFWPDQQILCTQASHICTTVKPCDAPLL